MIEPYYDHAGITIFNCDCREVLPQLEPVDLVLTDPQYGIKWDTNYSRFSKGSTDKTPIRNDDKPFDPLPFFNYPTSILWGANNYTKHLPRGSWLVWDKRNKDGSAFLSDAEMAWWSHGRGVYLKTISGQRHRATSGGLHPTQKPVSLMVWCIKLSKTTGTILDPFAGSCTTAVAAKNLGRKCICIEIEEKYCEIGARRLAQEVLPLT